MKRCFTIAYYTAFFTILLTSVFTIIIKSKSSFTNKKEVPGIILLSENEHELIDETIGIDSITILC